MRKQLLENTKGRDSVLGTYDIDENGDTTLTDYGLYDIKDGQLTFVKAIKAQGAELAASILSPDRIRYAAEWGRAQARPRRVTPLRRDLEAASASADATR